jgi:cytochrome bd-type quinol oxidase subunit 2
VRARLRALDPISLVAAIVIAFGVVQLFAGAWATGITTDEPAGADRLASWIATGWYLPPSELEDGEPKSGEKVLSSPYVYGPAFSLIAHAANIAVGNEGRGEVARTRGAYGVRHTIVALLALLAVLAVGVSVWSLTRSRRFGLWSAAALLAVPAWMGQGFFNFKDIPAGTGYTLVTAGLILALGEEADRPGLRLRRAAVVALLAGGILVGAGTRLSLWAPFLASFLTYAALRVGRSRLGHMNCSRGTDVAVLGGGVLGALAIAVTYPKAAAAPLSLLVESISGSANYPNLTQTLVAGQVVGYRPPFWYLPTYVAASYPLLLGLLAIACLVLGVRALIKVRAEQPLRRKLWERNDLGLVLVLQQAALLPFLAVVDGAVMYDGIRQHLYVIPALAILSGVGAAKLWGWSRRREKSRRPALAAILLALALVIPMAEQTVLFPYNYAYVNAVAGIGGVNDRWETDFWQASWPEALSHVPRGVELTCAWDLVPPRDPRHVPLKTYPCPGEQLGPFRDERGADTTAEPGREPPARWVIALKRGGDLPPDTCEQVADVTRWLRGESLKMSYVLRCPK